MAGTTKWTVALTSDLALSGLEAIGMAQLETGLAFPKVQNPGLNHSKSRVFSKEVHHVSES